MIISVDNTFNAKMKFGKYSDNGNKLSDYTIIEAHK